MGSAEDNETEGETYANSAERESYWGGAFLQYHDRDGANVFFKDAAEDYARAATHYATAAADRATDREWEAAESDLLRSGKYHTESAGLYLKLPAFDEAVSHFERAADQFVGFALVNEQGGEFKEASGGRSRAADAYRSVAVARRTQAAMQRTRALTLSKSGHALRAADAAAEAKASLQQAAAAAQKAVDEENQAIQDAVK